MSDISCLQNLQTSYLLLSSVSSSEATYHLDWRESPGSSHQTKQLSRLRNAMEERNAGPGKQPTVLIGKKDGVTFEMWVEIDGRTLEVYGEAEMEGGGSEAWIASEDGKVCLPKHRDANV